MANGTDLDLNKVIANLIVGASKVSPMGVGGEISKNKQAQSLLKSISEINPTAVGNALTSEDKLPSTEKPEPGPNEKIVQGAIDKRKKAQVEEALNGSSPTQVLQQAIQMDQQESQKKSLGQVLGGIGKFLLDTGSQKPGEFRQPSALGGLIKPSIPNQAILQQMAGEAPLQIGEYEKILLQGQVDVAKEQIKQATVLAKEGTLKPSDILTKYETAIKPFVLQRNAFGRILASAQDPSAAGDLALIFNYMKVLDPGSTVREGEFATAQNSAGIPARLRGTYNRIFEGKRLAPEQRVDFVDRAKRLFKNAELQAAKTKTQFSNLARNNRIDPSGVIRDPGLAQEAQPFTAASGNTTPFRTTASGNTARRVG